MPADPLDAALLQLAAHGERLAVLDDREAAHAAAVSGRLTKIAEVVEALGRTVKDQAAILDRLQALDEDVAQLAARLARAAPVGEEGAGAYQPVPSPKWWKLSGEARQEAVTRLRAWVEQVYRPGYGQLAASLGPCWEAHDLCLYALDIASDLWSVLYLQPHRTPGLLSAQAEYQTRVLPALAGQLVAETSRCGHAQARKPRNGGAGSRP